ncbi:MAG: hypothetical protein U0797_23230 [Gemmataceae bacterium]
MCIEVRLDVLVAADVAGQARAIAALTRCASLALGSPAVFSGGRSPTALAVTFIRPPTKARRAAARATSEP